MKNMGASEDQVSSETAAKQARPKLSRNAISLIALICALVLALTVLAIANSSETSVIADNPNPMASGELEEMQPDYGEKIAYHEEEMCGSDKVAFYATEGGTLTHDPNDDPFIAVDYPVDEPVPVKLLGTYGVQTGLKHYLSTIAVTPYAHGGSITAVPDPGYYFVGWNNGKSTNPKVYIQGACGGYNMTAHFEKVPAYQEPKEDIPIKGEDIYIEEPNVGTDKVEFYAAEGGTLTHDPSDGPFNKIDDAVDDPAPAKLLSAAGVQTGLKQYLSTIAVTPYAYDGSITAVPDPGYYFVGWNNGKNTNPKVYIQGACGGYNMTAHFEKVPAASSASPKNMNVYAQNALDGKVTLAQGKSVSLNGLAVLADKNYSGSVTGKVKYETSNASIATVNEAGKVTASTKKSGTAKITLSSVDNPNCKKVVTVKVVKKAKYVAPKGINKVNLKKQYKANAKKQIAVKVTSWNPKAPSNKNFTVSVSPSSRASVDPATNKVTFKAKGAVKVTVKSVDNPKAKMTVNVKVN